MNVRLKKMVMSSMMAAAGLLLYFLEIPMFTGPMSFLQFNFSNIPAVLVGVICGPIYGVAVEFVKNLLQFMIKGLSTQGGIGNIMDFLVGSAFAVTFSAIYGKFENKKLWMRIVLPSVAGFAGIVLVGAVGNYFITPLYFRYFLGATLEREFILAYVGAATILNVTKGAVLCFVAQAVPLKQLRKSALGA